MLLQATLSKVANYTSSSNLYWWPRSFIRHRGREIHLKHSQQYFQLCDVGHDQTSLSTRTVLFHTCFQHTSPPASSTTISLVTPTQSSQLFLLAPAISAKQPSSTSIQTFAWSTTGHTILTASRTRSILNASTVTAIAYQVLTRKLAIAPGFHLVHVFYLDSLSWHSNSADISLIGSLLTRRDPNWKEGRQLSSKGIYQSNLLRSKLGRELSYNPEGDQQRFCSN